MRVGNSYVAESVRVFKLEYILQYYKISYEGLICSMLLQGNDFVNGIPYRLIPSNNCIKSIDGLISFVRKEIRTKQCVDLYCSINNTISPSTVRNLL